MADYYPLIARAIAGLDPAAPGESRRALYERARAALIAQLRSVQPSLSESEITRERLSVEEAVRKVESEAAQRAREAARAPGGAARPGDALRRAGARAGAGDAGQPSAAAAAPRPRPAVAPPPPPSTAPAPSPAPQPPPWNDRPPSAAEDRSARGPRADAPPLAPRPQPPPAPPQPAQPQVTMQDPQLPPTRERTGVPRRGPENSIPQAPGMRGFRDITADADDLGRAAAQANRAARKTYANVPSPSPEFDRLEPSMENRGDPDAPYSYDESAEEAERYAAPPPAPRPRIGRDADREPKKRARAGAVFPFKSAIAIG